MSNTWFVEKCWKRNRRISTNHESLGYVRAWVWFIEQSSTNHLRTRCLRSEQAAGGARRTPESGHLSMPLDPKTWSNKTGAKEKFNNQNLTIKDTYTTNRKYWAAPSIHSVPNFRVIFHLLFRGLALFQSILYIWIQTDKRLFIGLSRKWNMNWRVSSYSMVHLDTFGLARTYQMLLHESICRHFKRIHV